jgi:uncharacterized protein
LSPEAKGALRCNTLGVMPWLVCEDRVLASLEVAETRAERRRGLIGRDTLEGALALRHTRSIHTFGVRFPIDVAYCNSALRVLRTASVNPNRLCLPVLRAALVIEAEAGSFARWGLRPGDELEIRQ